MTTRIDPLPLISNALDYFGDTDFYTIHNDLPEEEIRHELSAMQEAILLGVWYPITQEKAIELVNAMVQGAGRTNRWDVVESCLNKILNTPEIQLDPKTEIRFRNRYAQALRYRNQLDLALVIYQDALEQAINLDDKALMGECCFFIAGTYMYLGQNRTALEFARQSVRYMEQGDATEKWMISAKTMLAGRLRNLNQSDEALETLLSFHGMIKALNDPIRYSRYLIDLCDNFIELNRYDEAIQWMEVALKVTPTGSIQFGKVLVDHGFVLERLGRTEDALNVLYRAQRSLKGKQIDPILHYELDHNLGLVLMKLGRNAEALARFEQLVAHTQAFGNRYLITSAYGRLGEVYLRLERYRESIEASTRALEVSAKMEHRPHFASSILLQLEDAKEAYRQFVD